IWRGVRDIWSRSGPACGHAVAIVRKSSPQVLVSLPERLQSIDRPYAPGDIGRQTGCIARGIVSHTVLGHTPHGDLEAVRDLAHLGASINTIGCYMCNSEPLPSQPGR